MSRSPAIPTLDVLQGVATPQIVGFRPCCPHLTDKNTGTSRSRASAKTASDHSRQCIEQAVTGIPLVYTYVLDPASNSYREGEVFTGSVKASAPFSVEIDLSSL
jgi:hypothetical protein